MNAVVRFTYRSGTHAGQTIEVGHAVTIGWAASNSFQVAEDSVSSLHCELRFAADGRPFIKDCDSTNGTFLNGARIREAELHDGDLLALGQAQFAIRLTPATAVATPVATSTAAWRRRSWIGGGIVVALAGVCLALRGPIQSWRTSQRSGRTAQASGREQPGAAAWQRAHTAEDARNYAGAVREYQQAWQELPERDGHRREALCGLIRCRALAGQEDQAIRLLPLLAQQNPGEAIRTGELACRQLFNAGRVAEAAKWGDSAQSAVLQNERRALSADEWHALAVFNRFAKRVAAAAWLEEYGRSLPWRYDEKALLKGMAGCMQSLNAFLRATYATDVLIGEGCNVSGRFEDHNYITLSQYPCKADLYLQWFARTGFPEYQEMAGKLIHRMYRVYHSTADRDGRNWLPTGTFVDEQGRETGFYSPERLNAGRDTRPYDQSKARYGTARDYMDAWGIGVWEVAKLADQLPEASRLELVTVLNGMVEFHHRPYMCRTDGDGLFWRTDAFCPLQPPVEIPEPDWELLGLDVIHAVIALHVLKQDTSPWNDSLRRFAAYYMRERPRHNAKRDQLVEYTDLRAMDLADYLERVCGDKTLSRWMADHIPGLYDSRRTSACLVTDGRCKVYSPLPVIELLARYDPARAGRIWRELFDRHVAPFGLHAQGRLVSINTSEYEAMIDTGLWAWQRGALAGATFRADAEKLLQLLGSPTCSRTVEHWMLDVPPAHRKVWEWEATPYDGYPNDVRPEGLYDGTAQAVYMNAGDFRGLEGAQEYVNQLTSPGGHHTERIRFGQMSTFNLLDTHTALAPRADERAEKLNWEVEYTVPACPEGATCMGVLDITPVCLKDAHWMSSTGFEVYTAEIRGVPIPYEVYFRSGLSRDGGQGHPGCDMDKLMLAFLLPHARAGQHGRVLVTFKNQAKAVAGR